MGGQINAARNTTSNWSGALSKLGVDTLCGKQCGLLAALDLAMGMDASDGSWSNAETPETAQRWRPVNRCVIDGEV